MKFEFATSGRIVFGPGTLPEIGPAAASLGKRALLVTGRNVERAQAVVRYLEAAKVSSTFFSVSGEPTIDTVREGTLKARRESCDLVIGFGGGSALDAAKSIAAMLTNDGDVLDYLEVIGGGKPLVHPSLPCLAVPTTAGTGSEVTRNAVLTSPEHQVKVSLRGAFLLPNLALIDPELTYTLPAKVTAETGLDALTQLIEPFVSNRANPMTDALAREGIRRAARSLRQAFQQDNDAAAREDMCVASVFGGLALANAGLGAVHGFASPIGGLINAPHGAVCAALLPHVMETNLRALRQRLSSHPALAKFDELGVLLTGKTDARAEDGIKWVRQLTQDLRITSLRNYGLLPHHITPLVQKCVKASSMKANPILLTEEELTGILEAA